MSKILLWSVLLLFFLFGFVPIALIAVKSFFLHGVLDFSVFKEIFSSSYTLILLVKSSLLSLFVTLLSFMFGIPIGILLEKTDIPYAKLLLALLSIPLILPPYTIALAYSHLFGEWFFSFWGVVFVEVTLYTPLAMLATFILLKTINPSLESAARIFFPWYKVIQKISLPLIFPSLLLVGFLLFLLSFGNYSVVNFLRYESFIVKSFVEFSAFYHYKLSFALSFFFLAFVLLLLYIEQRYTVKRNYQSSLHHITLTNAHPILLKQYKGVLSLTLWSVTFLFSLLPLAVIISEIDSLYAIIFALKLSYESILRTLLYAFGGATFVTLFGFVIAYSKRIQFFHFAWLFDTLAMTLFALPSTLTGIALLLFFNHQWSNFIYASPLLLLIGYSVKYTALSNRIVRAQLRTIPHSMEDSAKLLGLGFFERLKYITLPLLKGTLFVSWLVSFIFILRDTDMSMILYSAGAETLSIKTFTLMANSSASLIASLNLIMVLLILLPFTLLYFKVSK